MERPSMPIAPSNVQQLWRPLVARSTNVADCQSSARQVCRQSGLATMQRHPKSHIPGCGPGGDPLEICYAAVKAHTHGPSWSSDSSYALSDHSAEDFESKDAYSWQPLSPKRETKHVDCYRNDMQRESDLESVSFAASPVKSLRHCDRVGSMPKLFHGPEDAPPIPRRSLARIIPSPSRSKSQPQLFYAADTTKSLPPIPTTNRSITHGGNINIHTIVNKIEIKPDACHNTVGKDFESESVRSLTRSVRPSFLDKKASYAPSYTSHFSTDSESENEVPNATFALGALSQARDSVRSSIHTLAASSPFKVSGRTSQRPSAIRISSPALADPLIAVDSRSQHMGTASTSWAADVQDNRSTYSSYYRPLKTPFPFPTLLPSPRKGTKRSRDDLTPTLTRTTFFPRRIRRLSNALQVFSKTSKKEGAASIGPASSTPATASHDMPPPATDPTAPQIRERILHTHERMVGGPDTPYYTDTEKVESPWRRHFAGLHLNGNAPSNKRRAKMWWKRVRGRNARDGNSGSSEGSRSGDGAAIGNTAEGDGGESMQAQKQNVGCETDQEVGMDDNVRGEQLRSQIQVLSAGSVDDEDGSAAAIVGPREDIGSWL